MKKEFRNKRVLITGGAKGIGLETARKFAEAGVHIYLWDIDAEALTIAGNALKQYGTDIFMQVGNVALENTVNKAYEAIRPIDVLINNVGIANHDELKNVNLQTWKKLIEVNLFSAINCTNAVLPEMLIRGQGNIVNVSSGQAFFRLPTWGAYAATKAALAVYSEVLHYEVRKYGVNITTIYPFLVNTNFYSNVQGKTKLDKLSMKLLPYYSDSPKKVANKIFLSVLKNKSRDFINPINTFGKINQFSDTMYNFVASLSSKFLI